MESSQNIFIKLENQNEIRTFLDSIKSDTKQIKELFKIYDELILKENTVLKSWTNSIENTNNNLDEIEI